MRGWLTLSIAFSLAAAAPAAAPPRPSALAKARVAPTKEPAYKTKASRYCLLAFGPAAKTRVWLALDGDVLYADKNGNGDLTEEGERVAGKAQAGGTTFEVGSVPDGKLRHAGLRVDVVPLARLAGALGEVPEYRKLVKADPGAKAFMVYAEVATPGRTGGGDGGRVQQAAMPVDGRGFLQFAARPQDAPVVHFGGPLAMGLHPLQKLSLGRDNDLGVGVGTPGLGAGTFAFAHYEGLVPEGVHPVVEITFPAKAGGKGPGEARYTLKERC